MPVKRSQLAEDIEKTLIEAQDKLINDAPMKALMNKLSNPSITPQDVQESIATAIEDLTSSRGRVVTLLSLGNRSRRNSTIDFLKNIQKEVEMKIGSLDKRNRELEDEEDILIQEKNTTLRPDEEYLRSKHDPPERHEATFDELDDEHLYVLAGISEKVNLENISTYTQAVRLLCEEVGKKEAFSMIHELKEEYQENKHLLESGELDKEDDVSANDDVKERSRPPSPEPSDSDSEVGPEDEDEERPRMRGP